MSGTFAHFTDDDFAWWTDRLIAAGSAADLHRLMGHVDSSGCNAWYSARDERNELAGYTADLTKAWEQAEQAVPSAEAAALRWERHTTCSAVESKSHRGASLIPVPGWRRRPMSLKGSAAFESRIATR